MKPEIIIGKNIQKKREEKGIKIEALGKGIGVTKGRMSQIENGECKELTINRMQKIAEYLKVDFFDITGNQTQYVDIKDSENCSGFYGTHYNITPEFVKVFVTELAKQMNK
jgi:transcriptional regulator with XRE-family HTH domain